MRLECVIVANPPVTGVTWYHEKQELVSAAPHVSIALGEQTPTPGGAQCVASLALDAFAAADEAKYTCMAVNDCGQKSTSCYVRTDSEGASYCSS